MQDMGIKKWGEVYRRVLLVNVTANVGVTDIPTRVSSGDGTLAPILISRDGFGMDGTKKLYFGDERHYMRRSREGVVEIRAPERVVINMVSAEGIRSHEIYATDLMYGEELEFKRADFSEKMEARRGVLTYASAENASIKKAWIKELDAENFIGKTMKVDAVSAEDLDVGTIRANEAVFDKMDYTEITACKLEAHTEVKTPTLNASKLKGCDNVMTWW